MRLSDWYAPRRIAYPWRLRPTPYRVLVSEIMLQQTQAARVAPAFRRFVRRFPSVRSLAAASRAEVVRAWAGLGYNRRALALAEAARTIVRDHGGRVPRSIEELRSLPGVGPYTAAAVASIAFGVPVVALDVNVGRVVSRVRLGTDGGPDAEVRAAAEAWLDRADPSGWNQALMDLGREHCRPTPRCEGCPLARSCRFRRSGASVQQRPRRQQRFEGSFRQVRGAVVRVLRERRSVSEAELRRATGFPARSIRLAVASLARDGLAEAGAPRGSVRLRE